MYYNVRRMAASKLQDTPHNSNEPLQQRPGMSPVRRRMLRGALGGVPVALAITTRPARALSTLQCQTPSVAQSMNTSRVEEVQLCYGRTPEYWKDPAHFDKWPHPFYAKSDAGIGVAATQFHAMGCSGGQFGNATMLQVLESGSNSGGQAQLGAYVCAAVLNAAGGMTPVLDVPAVLNLWNECSNRGYYEATAGVRWTGGQVVQYLKTTMSA
jgi:hypothetical protein